MILIFVEADFSAFMIIPFIPYSIWVIFDSYKQCKLYNKHIEETGKKPEW
jgi:hypothetical protein